MYINKLESKRKKKEKKKEYILCMMDREVFVFKAN